MEITRTSAPTTPAAAVKPALWPVVGKAWVNKTKKGNDLINVVLGNQREPFETITLKPGDKLALRPNAKREGKKDADYQVCIPA